MGGVWDNWNKESLYTFLRNGVEGYDNISRQWLKENLSGKVLDCGCGAGVDYEQIKDVCDYTGMDFTPKMLELCRENFPDGNFVEGNIEKIPFEDKSFDIVFCRHVLEHLSHYEKAIDEMRRVGKKVIVVLFRPILKKEKITLISGITNDNSYDKRILEYFKPTEIIELGKNKYEDGGDYKQWVLIWE